MWLILTNQRVTQRGKDKKNVFYSLSIFSKYPVSWRMLKNKTEVDIFSKRSFSDFQWTARFQMTSRDRSNGSQRIGSDVGSGIRNRSEFRRKVSAGISVSRWSATKLRAANPEPWVRNLRLVSELGHLEKNWFDWFKPVFCSLHLLEGAGLDPGNSWGWD